MADSDTDRDAGSETEEHADLLRKARKRFDHAWEADRPNREAGFDDLKMLAAEQWDTRIYNERMEENRPCEVENRLPQFVRRIVGDIRQQRPSIRVRPVDDVADPKTAEVMTSLIRDIEDRSANEQPYVKAAESAVRCGIGHFRILTDYARIGGFEQEIRMEPISNPFAVVWDPKARDVTRRDADYCFVTDMIPLDDFKAKWPDAQVVEFDGGKLPDDFQYAQNWYEADAVRVAEYWYKEPIKRRFARVSGPDGERIIELKGDEEAPEGAEVREVDDVKVCMVKLSGHAVLEEEYEWMTRDIPIIAVVGDEVPVGDRVVRSGAIRDAKGPQKRLNAFVSTQVELLALQPKAPFIATAAQIKGYEAHWRDANTKNNAVLLYNHDPNAPSSRPERQPPPMASAAIGEQIALASEAMKATTGVYDASLGNQSNETSGRAIIARDAQASTSAYLYTDNLTASVRHAGGIVLDLIPQTYPDTRVVRIVGKDGAEDFAKINVPVMTPEGVKYENDLTVGRYDLVITTGPAYATKRQEAADAMMEFLRTSPQQAALVMDLVVEAMDWPGAEKFAERFRKALPPALQPKDDNADPDPEEQAKAQAAQQAAALQQLATMLNLRMTAAKTKEAEANATKANAEAFEAEAIGALKAGMLDDVLIHRLLEVLAQNAPPPPGPVGLQAQPMGQPS